MKIKDLYETRAPSSQNILDIFDGEFKTKMLEKFNLKSNPGDYGGFDDARIYWAEKQLGSFKSKKILELGPLELAHSYIMSERGAEKITAIESNSKCFLKSLCIKNILSLDRVDLLFGDFNKFMSSHKGKFDFILASGVLYHMMNPVHTIKKISLLTDNVFIWTHIFNDNMLNNNELSKKFSKGKYMYDGFEYKGAVQSYGNSLASSNMFCGGPGKTSFWLNKESLIFALKKYGFKDIIISSEHSNINQNNRSCIAMFCKK